LSEGSSSKFWEIEVRDRDQIVRSGRIGTAGQTKTKAFADPAAARAASDALIEEKLAKGYVEAT
jgi:predicted DNA-binding WGR domain protein